MSSGRTRKAMAARYASGKVKPVTNPELMSPAEIRRLSDAAGEGLRDALWGSQLGRLHLQGKITSSQFSAGKKWNELVGNYAQACQAPREPRTISFDAHGGEPADPDSEVGKREVRRHERASAMYVEGRNALRLAGPTTEGVVDSVCVRDQAPAGFNELEALRGGLWALSTLWTTRRKARS